MRLFWHQLRAEQVLFWRSRESAFFIFLFPLLLFVLLASVYSGDVDGHPARDVLLVGILGYGVANTGFGWLAISLVIRREMGVLKRLRSTPLPPATYLAAVLASLLVVYALQSAAVLALGVGVYGAEVPDRIGSLALALLFGAGAFAGLGMGAAALIRSSEGSSAVINVVVLPMAFLSGSFVPRQEYPEFLRTIGNALPLTYFIDVVADVLLDAQAFWSQPGALAVVGLWGAAGLAVAVRRFGWEPRER